MDALSDAIRSTDDSKDGGRRIEHAAPPSERGQGMTDSFSAFERHVLETLLSDGRPIYVIDGGDGSGLTQFLLAVRDAVGERRCQYLDFERVATTPERFLRAIVEHSPFRAAEVVVPQVRTSPREAFQLALRFLTSATTHDDQPAIFLLDEALEVRTFENFPGLRTVAQDFVSALADSPNRFVMTTRFVRRARRLLNGATDRFRSTSIRPMAPAEVAQAMASTGSPAPLSMEVAATVRALTQGRPAYVHALACELRGSNPSDPVAALAAQMTPGGQLYARLRYSYEVRLHRARGYGALKAILDVLAEDEPLTLTEISQRLQRTPGSTKDYLSWLEDVDLVAVERKRYTFSDPLLRLWVGLHCRSNPVAPHELTEAVRQFAGAALLTPSATVPVAQPATSDARARSSGIIEID